MDLNQTANTSDQTNQPQTDFVFPPGTLNTPADSNNTNTTNPPISGDTANNQPAGQTPSGDSVGTSPLGGTSTPPADTSTPPPAVPSDAPTTTTEESPVNKKLADLSFEEFNKIDLLDAIGVKNPSPEERKQLEEKMMETIRIRVLDKIDQTLSPEAAAEWQKIVEGESEDAIDPFLKKNNLDINQLMLDEAVIYKMEMLKIAEDAKNSSTGSPANSSADSPPTNIQ